MADLAALAGRTEDGPDFKKASSRTAAPNPFEDILRQSYENGTAKSVTVGNDDEATAVERAVRRAGAKLEIGVRIGKRTRGDFGRPVVHFKGVAKRQSNGDAEPETSEDESPED